MTMHSTPATTPIPVTMLAPTVNWVPHAASGENSRKGESRSTSNSIRSLTSSRPRSWWRSEYRGPPPARARSSWSSSASRAVSWALRFSWKAVEPTSSTEVSAGAEPSHSPTSIFKSYSQLTILVNQIGSELHLGVIRR